MKKITAKHFCPFAVLSSPLFTPVSRLSLTCSHLPILTIFPRHRHSGFYGRRGFLRHRHWHISCGVGTASSISNLNTWNWNWNCDLDRVWVDNACLTLLLLNVLEPESLGPIKTWNPRRRDPPDLIYELSFIAKESGKREGSKRIKLLWE